MYTLGIHGNFGTATHDAAAVLIRDNQIVAAGEEERFTRYKHAVGILPDYAIKYCLDHAGIAMKDVDYIAFPAATWTNFDSRLRSYLWYTFDFVPKIEYIDHHTAHAASSFLLSGFPSALVLTLDLSGDGVSCGIFRGSQNRLQLVDTITFPDSLGLFAAFITQYLGFRSNHDEYKVMGLSAYGKPTIDLSRILRFTNGNLKFNQALLHPEVLKRYPVFHTSQLPMFRDTTYSFLPQRRLKNEPLLSVHKDLAASAQKVIEDAIFALIHKYKTQEDTYLCMAGGVAENSVANGKIAQSHLFNDVYVAPVCSDAGSALGAAVYVATQNGFHFEKVIDTKWGPGFTNAYIQKVLESYSVSYTYTDDVSGQTARLLTKGNIVGWFEGRMEFGSRALGGRSILADPRSAKMKERVNTIKKREAFRPFGSSILDEHHSSLFATSHFSPFMSFTIQTTKKGTHMIPASVHIDGTSRVQSVGKNSSLYRKLLENFYDQTGVPALLNTSFNSSWEPIVMSPEQALAFFYSSALDVLVMGKYMIRKKNV